MPKNSFQTIFFRENPAFWSLLFGGEVSVLIILSGGGWASQFRGHCIHCRVCEVILVVCGLYNFFWAFFHTQGASSFISVFIISRCKSLREASEFTSSNITEASQLRFISICQTWSTGWNIMVKSYWHSVWKLQKKSQSILRAKRATFTIWVHKSSSKMPNWWKMPKLKMRHFG